MDRVDSGVGVAAVFEVETVFVSVCVKGIVPFVFEEVKLLLTVRDVVLLTDCVAPDCVWLDVGEAWMDAVGDVSWVREPVIAVVFVDVIVREEVFDLVSTSEFDGVRGTETVAVMAKVLEAVRVRGCATVLVSCPVRVSVRVRVSYTRVYVGMKQFRLAASYRWHLLSPSCRYEHSARFFDPGGHLRSSSFA